MKTVMLWEHFQPGGTLGEMTQVFEEPLAQTWRSIFGHDTTQAEASGIAIAMMMRGFLGVVSPRPPGNIHARQRFNLHALPQPGERVRTVVTCLSKEVKRERRYVDFQLQANGTHDRPLYDGILTLIWAA